MRTDGTAPLDHYIKPLLEHKKLIVLVTAVAGALGLAASFLLPARYEATASVLLTPISGNPLSAVESDSTVDMPTELLIATSKAVMGQVSEDLASQSISLGPEALADNVTATSPKDSRILDLTYSASTPELAQVVANTFASGYLDYRADIASQNRTDSVDILNERVAVLKEELAEVETQLARAGDGTQRQVELSVEHDSITSELDAQMAALASLSTLSVDAGEILSAARLPTAPSGPGLPILLVGSLLTGLIVGSILAMLVGAIKASNAPRNRRATDRLERLPGGDRRGQGPGPAWGRRATDLPVETASAQPSAEAARFDEPVQIITPDDEPAADPAIEPAVEPVAAVATPTEPEPVVPAIRAATTTMPIAKQAVQQAAARPGPHEPRTETPPPPPPGPNAKRPSPTPVAASTTVSPLGDDDIPPPPRNKAKLIETEDAGATTAPVAPPAPTGPKVEATLDGFLTRIAKSDNRDPLVCLAVGEATRAQSVATGFALADAAGRLDAEVLIIDAALDEPSLSTALELSLDPGLSEVLLGREPMAAAIHELPDFDGLYAMTTGRVSLQARSALRSPQLAHVLIEARSRFSLIVVIAGTVDDAASLGRSGGGLETSINGLVDGVVLGNAKPVGQTADADLTEKLATLPAPVWSRISISDAVAGSVGQTTAASAM